jgi:DOPA 4,5-dioxygenase
MDIDKIKYYHAHLYFNEGTIKAAKSLGEAAQKMFGVRVGTYHERPVGPHPVWSCQLTVPESLFAKVIPWLTLNRGPIDCFVHPVTGDDLDDHTKYAMWLGSSYDLNLKIFES